MKSLLGGKLFAALAAMMSGSLLPPLAFGDHTPERCRKGKQPDGVFRLATGPLGGSYVEFGKVLAKQAPPDLKIVPCTTDGSLENIELLTQGDVEFALAQQDLLHIGWSKEPAPKYTQGEGAKAKWPEHFDDVKLVRWLYSERLQIVAGPHSYISSLADATKGHFWLGPERGGTYATAVEVLRAAGMSLEEIKQNAMTGGDFEAANNDLFDRRVPVIFRTTPVPARYSANLKTSCNIRRLGRKPLAASAQSTGDNADLSLACLFQSEPEVQLVGLDNALLKRLKQNPSYVIAPIYRNTYTHQKEGIQTIGIEAALITRDTVPDSVILELFDFLSTRSARTKIEDAMNVRLDLLNKKLDPTNEDDEELLVVGAHPIVRERLTASLFDRYGLTGEIGLCFLLLLVLVHWHNRLRRFLRNNAKYVVTTSMIVIACGIFGLILWLIEGRFTSGFQNPLVAAWSLIVYFAQGLKTETLVTSSGQFTALLALAVIATLVHALNSDALDQATARWTNSVQHFFREKTKEKEKSATSTSCPKPNGGTPPEPKDLPPDPAPKPIN